ncbi:MAG: asparagine synthetase B [Bacteroidota bacterium]
MKKLIIYLLLICTGFSARADYILIPMDYAQSEHLKAYGIAFWVLTAQVEVDWLLNYRGGSFMFRYSDPFAAELRVRNVKFERISDARSTEIIAHVTSENVNMDAVKLEKAPNIAVYTPSATQPWDDAVTLALTYAEIPYEKVYDAEVLAGKLGEYDWLHLHHEDFTGQFGKFYGSQRNQQWYQDEVRFQTDLARIHGYTKVSESKRAVALELKRFLAEGGFLFAMCSATDSYDIALAAENVDICGPMFDGDPADAQAQEKLNYTKTLAFKDFQLVTSPFQYEFSDIDTYIGRRVPQNLDYFTLFDFSAKYDPVPTMLTQNHTRTVKGFMGQTTSFHKSLLKPEVTIMGELKAYGEARYIHGNYEKGMWTFYGGHDPEDYRHTVGEDPTDLTLHPSSPGYRLILNNILFPAARKKKLKT